MITRRSFLLGSTAGLFLPSFYDKAISFLENHDEPLLISPKKHDSVLYVEPDRSYGLFLGDPYDFPEAPRITIREFYALEFGVGDVNQYLLDEGYEPEDLPDLDGPIGEWEEEVWFESWARHESPNAEAYHYLHGLDLGSQLQGATAIGGIRLIDGDCPGSDYLGAEAENAVSVSLLQQRLNELNTGVRIKLI